MHGNHTKGRLAARLALVIAFGMALAIPVAAFFVRGSDKPETWMISAAALAVITSIIGAWSSRRVVELQEDSQQPNPYPAFDVTSRFGIAMLTVKNTGATAAHNISLTWNMPLKNRKGKVIGFSKRAGGPAISVLLPGERISQLIGAHHEFLQDHSDTEYTGRIDFQDPSGYLYERPFRLDGRSYSGALSACPETL